MTYTVIWTPNADQRLVNLCVQYFAHGLGAIAVAVNTIETMLRHDPQTKGVVHFDTVRMLSVPPLNIEFEADDGDMKVFVLTVWHD